MVADDRLLAMITHDRLGTMIAHGRLLLPAGAAPPGGFHPISEQDRAGDQDGGETKEACAN